jgi:hypothetical protein
MHSLIVGKKQVSQETLEAIIKLTQSGSTPDDISFALDLNIQTVIQVIAYRTLHKDFDQEVNQCKQAQLVQKATLQRLQAQSEVPTFIYSYKYDTDQLHRTNLVTAEHSNHRVPTYRFK